MPRSTRSRPSKASNPAQSASPASTSPDHQPINYRLHPHLYRILRGELNVFKTDPYSAELKGLWRFKDEKVARKSAEDLWERFEGYRAIGDFVGMDVTRKFIQMGRTRSLRYALRPGGRKYDPADGQEMERTGEVADQSKLEGAKIFETFLKRVEEDEVYVKTKADWVDKYESKKGKR